MPLQKTLKQSQASLAQSLEEFAAPFLWSWWTQDFVCALQASLAGVRFDSKCERQSRVWQNDRIKVYRLKYFMKNSSWSEFYEIKYLKTHFKICFALT